MTTKFKKHSHKIFVFCFTAFFCFGCTENLFNGDDKTVNALKQALEIGVEKSVINLSGKDGALGYFKDEAVKIFLPEQAQSTFALIKKIDDAGGGAILNIVGVNLNFENTLVELINRAAEDAVPQATSIFVDAIKDMTISNGKDILFGSSNAATTYLVDKTSSRLEGAFAPVIGSSLSSDKITVAGYTPMGAWKAFADINKKIVELKNNQLASLALMALPSSLQNQIKAFDYVEPDLGVYVTGKALDGLFTKVADEEYKIRTDASARVTDLLKDVFGQLDK